MRLVLRVLGLELIDLDFTTDAPDDTARDLSGGYLGSTGVEVGECDRVMGFTNGLECDE